MVVRNSFVVFSLLIIGSAQALTMRPLNIEELADRSHQIVRGTVLSVEEAPAVKSALPAIVAHVQVDETLKGAKSKELTIRQFAMLGPQKKLRVPYGLPTFRKGERVIVFMPSSTSTGFASPVGLGQGVFRILGDKPDSAIVNEFGNRTLFHGTLSSLTRGVMKRLSFSPLPGKPQSLTVSQLKEFIHERLLNAK